MPSVSPVKTMVKIPETPLVKSVQKLQSRKFLDRLIADPDFLRKTAFLFGASRWGLKSVSYAVTDWFNRKIPEEERKFSATLDLLNGIAHIALIIPFNAFFERKYPKWSQKIFKTLEKHPLRFSQAKLGLDLLVSLLIIDALGQRFLTPYITTPLAKAINNTFMKPKQKQVQDTNPITIPVLPQEKQSAQTDINLFHHFLTSS